MAKKSNGSYKMANDSYLADMASRPGVRELANGILYKVLEAGSGKSPGAGSVVSVYYKGSLINGRVFDDNTGKRIPDAFRLRDLIVGWQIALRNMREGDRWQIYIPAAYGYGSRPVPGIPGGSALVFDVRLVKVN